MSLLTLQYQSAAIVQGTTLKIFLPTDMITGRTMEPPFKTLYFLPGFSADSTTIMTYLSVRLQSEEHGVAVVIPDGFNSFYIDRTEIMANFGSFIQEIVETTRKLLPLSDKRSDTYIGGISMGGWGSLYHGMKSSRLFSKVISFSPAIDILELANHEVNGFTPAFFRAYFGTEEDYLAGAANLKKAYLESKPEDRPELFLCCGKQDSLVYGQVADFHKYLAECGYTHTYVEEDGDHEVFFWERMMKPAFDFLNAGA